MHERKGVCAMRINFRSWRWTIPTLAALAWFTPGAEAQQPLSAVELAQPIAAEPAAAEPTAAEPAEVKAQEVEAGAPAASDESTAEDGAAKANAPQKMPAPPTGAEEPGPLPDAGALVELIKERYPGGAVKIEREITQDNDGNYMLH